MLIKSQDGERLVNFGDGNYLVISRERGRKLTDSTCFSVDCRLAKDFTVKLAEFETEAEAREYLNKVFGAAYSNYKAFEG